MGVFDQLILQVAALAGVPKGVIKRARQYLALLESQQTNEHPQTQLPFSVPLDVEPDQLAEAVDDIDPDELTPRQALDAIYSLKKLRNDKV